MYKREKFTGEHLKLARLNYGFRKQEDLAKEAGKSLATIQRYEALKRMDSRVLDFYEYELHFEIIKVADWIESMRARRKAPNLLRVRPDFITGEDLMLARLNYGFETQESLAKEAGKSLATIHRYEKMKKVDFKILWKIYARRLQFDINMVTDFVRKIRRDREKNDVETSLSR
jgi:transcriptional regulator with XRE-family HTH domain